MFYIFFFIIPATAYAPWAHFAVFKLQREGVTEIGCQGEINTAKKSRESLFSLSHVLRVLLQTVGLICPLLSIYPTLHKSRCHCGLFLTQHSVTGYSQVWGFLLLQATWLWHQTYLFGVTRFQTGLKQLCCKCSIFFSLSLVVSMYRCDQYF